MDGLIDANLIVRRNAYLWFGIGTPPVMIGDVRAYLDTHLRMYVRRRRSDLRTYIQCTDAKLIGLVIAHFVTNEA